MSRLKLSKLTITLIIGVFSLPFIFPSKALSEVVTKQPALQFQPSANNIESNNYTANIQEFREYALWIITEEGKVTNRYIPRIQNSKIHTLLIPSRLKNDIAFRQSVKIVNTHQILINDLYADLYALHQSKPERVRTYGFPQPLEKKLIENGKISISFIKKLQNIEQDFLDNHKEILQLLNNNNVEYVGSAIIDIEDDAASKRFDNLLDEILKYEENVQKVNSEFIEKITQAGKEAYQMLMSSPYK